MRYPYTNFPQDWNLNAGNGFGDQTTYGYHEGVDINDWGGGNSDIGKPIYAIADGVVTSVHNHTTKPTFGNHLHYKIVGPWGERWDHHAHLSEIFVVEGQQVKEGQLIAKIGNSGTTYGHDHWAIKKQPTGTDGLATTLERLQLWENPLEFVKKWSTIVVVPPAMDAITKEQLIIDAYKALTGDFPTDAEKQARLQQNLNTVDLIVSLTGDGRFYSKFIQPVVQQKDDRIGQLDSEIRQLRDLIAFLQGQSLSDDDKQKLNQIISLAQAVLQ